MILELSELHDFEFRSIRVELKAYIQQSSDYEVLILLRIPVEHGNLTGC